jgi:hypothetical protein
MLFLGGQSGNLFSLTSIVLRRTHVNGTIPTELYVEDMPRQFDNFWGVPRLTYGRFASFQRIAP